MKNLKEYLITEHFVNCKNEEEMKQYGDIVWKILQKAYEYCGGIKNVNSVDDLIKDTHLWKLYRHENKIKAGINIQIFIFNKYAVAAISHHNAKAQLSHINILAGFILKNIKATRVEIQIHSTVVAKYL